MSNGAMTYNCHGPHLYSASIPGCGSRLWLARADTMTAVGDERFEFKARLEHHRADLITNMTMDDLLAAVKMLVPLVYGPCAMVIHEVRVSGNQASDLSRNVTVVASQVTGLDVLADIVHGGGHVA